MHHIGHIALRESHGLGSTPPAPQGTTVHKFDAIRSRTTCLVSITSHCFFASTTSQDHTTPCEPIAAHHLARRSPILRLKLVAHATVAPACTRDSTRDSTALHHRVFPFSRTRPHSQCRVCAKCRLHRPYLHHIHIASSHTPRHDSVATTRQHHTNARTTGSQSNWMITKSYRARVPSVRASSVLAMPSAVCF